MADGSTPGAVGLVARGDRVDVKVVGSVDAAGTSPMARDSIFRIASITKPITAAAVMMLVEDGRIALDDPVDRWLPELASPDGRPHAGQPGRRRGPGRRGRSPCSTCSPSAPGYGFPSDFSLPAVAPLFSELQQGPPAAAARRGAGRVDGDAVPHPAAAPAGRGVALQHLLRHPGRADRAGLGQPLPEFLAERLFEPLGMVDTGFAVPAGEPDRFTSYYRADAAGGLELVDAPGRAVEQPAGVPVRRRRPGLHRRRLARLRPDAARRRPVDGRALLSPTRCGR